MAKKSCDAQKKTTREVAMDMAAELAYGEPYFQASNDEAFGNVFCEGKWLEWTVNWSGDAITIYSRGEYDEWGLVFSGTWKPQYDYDLFMEALHDGKESDDLVAVLQCTDGVARDEVPM